MTAPDARMLAYEAVLRVFIEDDNPPCSTLAFAVVDILCPPGSMRVIDRRGDTPLLHGLEHVDLLAEIVRVWDAGGEWIRGEFEVLMDEARRLSPVGDPDPQPDPQCPTPFCSACYPKDPCRADCYICHPAAVGDPEPGQGGAEMTTDRIEELAGERCQACGEQYDDVYQLPDAAWRFITPKPETPGAGLLCPKCAAVRLADVVGNLGALLQEVDCFPSNDLLDHIATTIGAGDPEPGGEA